MDYNESADEQNLKIITSLRNRDWHIEISFMFLVERNFTTSCFVFVYKNLSVTHVAENGSNSKYLFYNIISMWINT